jgi:hypothetical protein
MPIFETKSGRRLDISPPPPGIWEELDEPANVYRKLVQERKVTGTRLGGVRGQRERAIEAERAALAKALKDGTKEPDSSKSERLGKDIEACERRRAALEEAIDLAIADLIVATDEHREEWTEEVLEQVAEAQTEYQQAVEMVASASQEVLAKIALLRFVRLFPEDEISYRIRGSNVLALRSPNGDPYSLYDVLAALREDARVTYDPKAWVSRDPHGAAIQARHDEKRRNEEKGLGYLTDAEIAEGLTPELVAKGL